MLKKRNVAQETSYYGVGRSGENLRRGSMSTFKKNGNWYIDYYVNGIRKREKTGTSKKQAETFLAKKQTQIAENKFLDIDRIERVKLKDFVALFIDSYSKPNKSSWKDDRNRLSTVIRHFGDNAYLDEITPYQIEQFKKQKLQEGTKPSTVNRYLTILKTMYKKAIEWGNAKENPLDNVKHFREDNQRLRFLEEEEIARLLEACTPYLKPIVITALNSGMRRGEIFGLKWSDVDFKRRIISIHKTKNNETKVLPMNNLIVNTLARVREHSTSEDVFPVKEIRKDFSNALKYAKISHCRFHDLRHTFASHLVMKGVDLMTVKELLGHKSIKMTERYSHLSQGHKIKAVEAISSVMVPIWTPNEKVHQLEKELNAITA
jgi:integrase